MAQADNRPSGTELRRGTSIFKSIAKLLRLGLPLIGLAFAACVHSSVIPLSQDTLQLTAAAAPVFGITGAQNYAARLAAVETIRHGYDRYVIVGGQYQNDVHVMGYTPVVAQTDSSATVNGFGNTATVNGNSTTTYSGGAPIVGGSHDQALVVKMFKEGDPAGGNAIPARQTLGPEWQKAVDEKSMTCLGQ